MAEGEFKLNLEKSTSVVIAAVKGNVRIFSDLADMQLLLVFRGALNYVQCLKVEQVQEEPQVSVITIVFDVKSQIFMTANTSWRRVRVMLASLVKDLLESTTVKVSSPGGTALQNLARVFGSKKPKS